MGHLGIRPASEAAEEAEETAEAAVAVMGAAGMAEEGVVATAAAVAAAVVVGFHAHLVSGVTDGGGDLQPLQITNLIKSYCVSSLQYSVHFSR